MSSRWEGARGLAAGLGQVEEAGRDGREVVVAGGQGLGWGVGGGGWWYGQGGHGIATVYLSLPDPLAPTYPGPGSQRSAHGCGGDCYGHC